MQAVGAERDLRTESRSRQFVIYGSDFVTRGAIASLAEGTREELGAQLGQDREWKHSIVIQLRPAPEGAVPPDAARLQPFKAFSVPGGFRLQLDVDLAKGKPQGLERALLELLLVERALRDQPDVADDVVLAVPPWLLDGFLESFRWRRGERDHELYAALFRENQLFPVKRLLDEEDPGDMDSLTRTAFRVSSGALVMALLESDGGKPAMNALLSEAASFEGDEMALLLAHFPGMNLGKESFAKWWALQLANMAETPFLKVLPILETERELEALLVVRFKDAEGGQYEVRPPQFRDLIALSPEQRREAILPVVKNAGVFLYNAFPEHRPLVAEYLQILGEIADDSDRDIEARLATLAARRAELAALGERTRDYLDWFRISSAKQLTGNFESFIELKSRLDSPPPRRDSPVSQYLDDIQQLYESK